MRHHHVMGERPVLLATGCSWRRLTSLIVPISFLFVIFPIEASSWPLSLTEKPPLLDSPTFSLATRNRENESNITTNMNILTYATPVAVRPRRVWCLGLYKDTLSYENWVRTGTGILQLLSDEADDNHVAVIKILGGSSGRDVNKETACADVGCTWIHLPDVNKSGESNDNDDSHVPIAPIQVLPNCVSYCRVSAIGEVIDMGSHAIAICQVDEMYASEDDEGRRRQLLNTKKRRHLSTSKLREMGIITEQGRVAEDPPCE